MVQVGGDGGYLAISLPAFFVKTSDSGFRQSPASRKFLVPQFRFKRKLFRLRGNVTYNRFEISLDGNQIVLQSAFNPSVASIPTNHLTIHFAEK